MDEIISALGSGAGIGSGAIAGSIIIVKFIQGAFKEMSLELRSMNSKLDEVIKNYEITKVKTEMEIDRLKVKLIELEKRIERILS